MVCSIKKMCIMASSTKKKKKKYAVITKITNTRYIKHRVNDIYKYKLFLNKNYPEWRYCNIYCNHTKYQISRMTKNIFSPLEYRN